ncbi:hypothetical protein [Brucella anthropi]|uniref:hypothetical protein n=1 Tax=Brucella anthropi TaxID=529 RepID=UPI0021572CF3|nr:hypothetical protein [Brucella anthropi]MCR8493685.1 hypothetical protein [Brucella anthropi]
MTTTDVSKTIKSFKSLSRTLRAEQTRLLMEAAKSRVPNKGIRREIAELELNIAAVENNLVELQGG